MFAGDFYQKLRKLNRKLRIFCGEDDSKPAGLYYIANNTEYVQVCGVDRNWLPEHTESHWSGRILKSGWRRPLRILIRLGLVERRKAESLFHTRFPYAKMSTAKLQENPVHKMIQEAQYYGRLEAQKKYGVDAPGYMKPEDIAEIGKLRKRLQEQGENV